MSWLKPGLITGAKQASAQQRNAEQQLALQERKLELESKPENIFMRAIAQEGPRALFNTVGSVFVKGMEYGAFGGKEQVEAKTQEAFVNKPAQIEAQEKATAAQLEATKVTQARLAEADRMAAAQKESVEARKTWGGVADTMKDGLKNMSDLLADPATKQRAIDGFERIVENAVATSNKLTPDAKAAFTAELQAAAVAYGYGDELVRFLRDQLEGGGAAAKVKGAPSDTAKTVNPTKAHENKLTNLKQRVEAFEDQSRRVNAKHPLVEGQELSEQGQNAHRSLNAAKNSIARDAMALHKKGDVNFTLGTDGVPFYGSPEEQKDRAKQAVAQASTQEVLAKKGGFSALISTMPGNALDAFSATIFKDGLGAKQWDSSGDGSADITTQERYNQMRTAAEKRAWLNAVYQSDPSQKEKFDQATLTAMEAQRSDPLMRYREGDPQDLTADDKVSKFITSWRKAKPQTKQSYTTALINARMAAEGLNPENSADRNKFELFYALNPDALETHVVQQTFFKDQNPLFTKMTQEVLQERAYQLQTYLRGMTPDEQTNWLSERGVAKTDVGGVIAGAYVGDQAAKVLSAWNDIPSESKRLPGASTQLSMDDLAKKLQGMKIGDAPKYTVDAINAYVNLAKNNSAVYSQLMRATKASDIEALLSSLSVK